jgi:hypothetical protein
MQAALGALNGAIQTTQEPNAPVLEETPVAAPTPKTQTLEEWVEAAIAAVGGAIRQQGEEIQELRDQVARLEIETKSYAAQVQALQSRVKADVPTEPPAAQPVTQPSKVATTPGRPGLLWRRLAWVAVAVGIPSASWWAYTQGGVIDAVRHPDPLPISIPKAPAPPVMEAPKASEAPAPPVAQQSVSVSVTAKEKTWLEAETDGDKVFGKVLLANQTKSFDASRRIKILTGNMAGTDVSYNGKQIGLLGNRHSVGAFIFTPQGWSETSARSNAHSQ